MKGTREDKLSFLNEILEAGGEGIMLKNQRSFYHPGMRPSDTWLKMKRSLEEDVVIMGFTEGRGKYAGQVGAIEFGQYVSGTLTKMGQVSGMTDDLRLRMTRSPDKYKGMVITITAMERFPGGTFRHPRFKCLRPEGDKDPKDCVYTGIQ